MKYAELHGNMQRCWIKSQYGNKLSVTKMQDMFSGPTSKLTEQLDNTTKIADQFNNIRGVVDAFGKHEGMMGS